MARTLERETNKKFQPWLISNGTKLLRHFDAPEADTTRDESTWQPSPEQLKFQQVLQSHTEATTEAVYHNSDGERGAAMLNDTIKEAWLDFKPRYITSKHSKGRRTMAELANPLEIEYCTKYIVEILTNDFSLVGDALFTEFFDTHFDTKQRVDTTRCFQHLR